MKSLHFSCFFKDFSRKFLDRKLMQIPTARWRIFVCSECRIVSVCFCSLKHPWLVSTILRRVFVLRRLNCSSNISISQKAVYITTSSHEIPPKQSALAHQTSESSSAKHKYLHFAFSVSFSSSLFSLAHALPVWKIEDFQFSYDFSFGCNHRGGGKLPLFRSL